MRKFTVIMLVVSAASMFYFAEKPVNVAGCIPIYGRTLCPWCPCNQTSGVITKWDGTERVMSRSERGIL